MNDGHYYLYSDDMISAHVSPYTMKSSDSFFIIIGKNNLNFWIVLLNSILDVFVKLAEVQREKSELIKHYWNSGNDIFEPELDIEEKPYIDKNNYQQYIDTKTKSKFVKLILTRYWTYLYLAVVLIFGIVQIINWMGYIETRPLWGLILLPIVFFILNKTFVEYGI
jgi:ABC-type antimicrobial peptide transport system permease subunit